MKQEYIVTEVVDYIVKADSSEHACELIANDRERDKQCVNVADRQARRAVRDVGGLTNLTDA